MPEHARRNKSPWSNIHHFTDLQSLDDALNGGLAIQQLRSRRCLRFAPHCCCSRTRGYKGAAVGEGGQGADLPAALLELRAWLANA